MSSNEIKEKMEEFRIFCVAHQIPMVMFFFNKREDGKMSLKEKSTEILRSKYYENSDIDDNIFTKIICASKDEFMVVPKQMALEEIR